MKALMLACATFVLVVARPAVSQPRPVDLTFDGATGANIERARGEIDRMGDAQLRSLLGYLAACRGRSTAPVSLQSCSEARAKYDIEFGKVSPAVDLAIQSAEDLLKVSRAIGGLVPPGTAEIDASLAAAVRTALQRHETPP